MYVVQELFLLYFRHLFLFLYFIICPSFKFFNTGQTALNIYSGNSSREIASLELTLSCWEAFSVPELTFRRTQPLDLLQYWCTGAAGSRHITRAGSCFF